MTVDVFGARQHSRNFSFAAEVFRREPLYAGAALCLAALIAPTLVAMSLDERTVSGVNVWLKPLRFELALTVYLATLAWFAGWLPQGVTTTRWYRQRLFRQIRARVADTNDKVALRLSEH